MAPQTSPSDHSPPPSAYTITDFPPSRYPSSFWRSCHFGLFFMFYLFYPTKSGSAFALHISHPPLPVLILIPHSFVPTHITPTQIFLTFIFTLLPFVFHPSCLQPYIPNHASQQLLSTETLVSHRTPHYFRPLHQVTPKTTSYIFCFSLIFSQDPPTIFLPPNFLVAALFMPNHSLSSVYLFTDFPKLIHNK